MIKNRRFWMIVAGSLVVIAALLAVLDKLHVITLFSHKSIPITASSYTKGEPHQVNTSQAPQTSGTTSDTKQGSQETNTTSTNTVLLIPTGGFVSNHHPNLSGSPAPNSLTSVCNTTPGATCEITFTKGDVTKSLPSETTDAGGVAYWNNWTLQSVGLSAGSWQVKAIASLNGQTKTALDALALMVSP
jgi:hypothetical protein